MISKILLNSVREMLTKYIIATVLINFLNQLSFAQNSSLDFCLNNKTHQKSFSIITIKDSAYKSRAAERRTEKHSIVKTTKTDSLKKNELKPSAGLTIGMILPYNFFGGDFNGENMLQGADAFVLLPEVKSNIGYGVILGMINQSFMVDLYFNYSKHKAKISNIQYSSEARFLMVGINFGFKMFKQPIFDPYILVGAGLGSIEIDSSAVKLDIYNEDYKIAQAEFFNYMINLGLGGILYLNNWLGLRGEIYYRFYQFGSVKLSYGGEYNLEENVGASAVNFSLILTLIIQ